MPMVTMASQKNKLDGSVERAAYKFLQKLQRDDTSPGLHIEPMINAVDERARTGRVNKQWRAVLYKLTSAQGNHYVYMGTYPHDEAIDIARTHKLKMNLALGVPEFERILEATDTIAPEPPAPEQISESPAPETAQQDSLPEWVNQLVDHWTEAELEEQAGIAPRFAQRALAATTMEQLTAVINEAPEAQGLVLLELAHGKDLDEVKEELGLEAVPPGDENEQLEQSLRRPATVGFVYVGDNPQELKDALESKNFDGWRVFLHPEQRRFAEQQTSGAYRISGGAGTGKTVVLVHRARNLAKRNPDARIVLTTFTKVLAESLSTQLKRLDANVPQGQLGQPGVAVLGIDQIAAKIVAEATDEQRREATQLVFGSADNALTSRTTAERQAFQNAVAIAQPKLPENVLHHTFLEQEYVTVVLANRVVDETGYIRANRKGRGTALNRKARKELWKVFAQFRWSQQLEDSVTFPELATIAAAILEQRAARGETLPADHVLVDEGQDLHSGHWALLRALVAEGPDDLFIAEDSHQRIYGQKVPLSRFGINIVGRARRLRLNYRTTAENLAFAVGILEGGDYTDLEDAPEDTSEYRSVRSGPQPRLVEAGSRDEQLQVAVDYIRQWSEVGVRADAIGVMVRSEKIQNDVKRRLREADALKFGGNGAQPEVQVMTMHSAKGMEFERAIIVGVEAQELPASWQLAGLPPAEQQDLKLRERSLLYVAATRARDELVITWSGEASVYL